MLSFPLLHLSSFPTKTFLLPHTCLSHFPIQLRNLPFPSQRSNFIFLSKIKKSLGFIFFIGFFFFLLFLLLPFVTTLPCHPLSHQRCSLAWPRPSLELPSPLARRTTTGQWATTVGDDDMEFFHICSIFLSPFVFFHICSFFFFLRLFFLFFVHGWIVEGGWC